MKVSYYPGCTLRTKAKQLDLYARKSAEALGITMEEIENWQCCGGVFSTAKDEIATKLSSVRALSEAAKKEQILVTVCSACHNVIKQTNHAMQNDEDFAMHVNRYMAPESYDGSARVLHYLEMLRDVVGFDTLKEKVVNPLSGKKIAAYYGCLLLRPGQTMQMDDVENPTILEDFIRALGAEPVIYAQRNECCGGYVAMEDPASAQKKSKKVLDSAASHGADRDRLSSVPLQSGKERRERNACGVLHRTAGGSTRREGGLIMENNTNRMKEQILRTSGVNPLKCMRCGKCSGTCPAYDEMEYHPHEFVYMVERGDIEPLLNSKSLYKCLTCFACVDRCPRDVEPAKLVEAVRLMVIRQQGKNHLKPDQIPEMLDDELPQQAIVSALRKYAK